MSRSALTAAGSTVGGFGAAGLAAGFAAAGAAPAAGMAIARPRPTPRAAARRGMVLTGSCTGVILFGRLRSLTLSPPPEGGIRRTHQSAARINPCAPYG